MSFLRLGHRYTANIIVYGPLAIFYTTLIRGHPNIYEFLQKQPYIIAIKIEVSIFFAWVATPTAAKKLSRGQLHSIHSTSLRFVVDWPRRGPRVLGVDNFNRS